MCINTKEYKRLGKMRTPITKGVIPSGTKLFRVLVFFPQKITGEYPYERDNDSNDPYNAERHLLDKQTSSESSSSSIVVITDLCKSNQLQQNKLSKVLLY